MPGKLIWLVGPSGSGKDSLLAALRQREHPQLLVAHRYITRPFNAGSENHIALSEHEFFTRAEQHLFALSWHANNTYYGIGVEIDLWLHAGFDVVANGSRAHRRWPGNATARCWCRSVSPSRRRCCASGWSSAAGKMRWKSPSVWTAPRAISRTTA